MSKKLVGMLAMIAAVSVFAVNVQAGNVYIYSESFSGDSGDDLHGTAPDVSVSSETWIANSEIKADGSIGGSDTASAFLPFEPEAGNIYTLSATLDQPTDGSWAAIGFTEGSDTTTFWGEPNNAWPWMLWRTSANDDEIDAREGPGVDVDAETLGDYTGSQTLSIVLNTEESDWTAEWFIDGVSQHKITSFSHGNPTIGHIALGRNNDTVVDTFHSFSLEVVASDAIIWTGRDTRNITQNAAEAAASVNTDLDEAVLVWDTEDHGTDSTDDWPVDNRLSLEAQTAGEVTGDMTNLDADTAYVWRMFGSTSETDGWSAQTDFVTSLSAAQNPVFTDATALSPVAIQLDWEDNAENETGYILQRSTTSGSGYTTIATLGQGVTTYEDSGLMPQTTYYYQLAATNSVNGSATAFEACRISATTPQASWATATGGHMYEAEIDGTRWQIHVFTNVGEHVGGLVIESPGDVEYLIVGGGGGAGSATWSGTGGGGGAGGLLQDVFAADVGSYDVVVGSGGPGSTRREDPGASGQASSIFNLTAIGGGGGGSRAHSTTTSAQPGQPGGSGGGGGGYNAENSGSGGAGTPGQGHDGHDWTEGDGGGGGGAGGPGSRVTGGPGRAFTFAGPDPVTYATGGDGGIGGQSYRGADAEPNTGDGGGAAAHNQGNNPDPDHVGGAGGSGIVIVRYQLPPQGTLVIFK